jgi:hypothetical protein
LWKTAFVKGGILRITRQAIFGKLRTAIFRADCPHKGILIASNEHYDQYHFPDAVKTPGFSFSICAALNFSGENASEQP